MKLPKVEEMLPLIGVLIVFCLLLQGWDMVISFIGILFTAIMPLILGIAIAYVVSIPTNFLKRHILPNSESKAVSLMRQPAALAVVVIVGLVSIALASVVLMPALVDTVIMVQKNGQQFVEDVAASLGVEPIRVAVHDFMNGEIVQGLKNLNIGDMVKSIFGGTVGSITTQVFTLVSTVMTCFFGMLFSFILLTDTTSVGYKIMNTLSVYLGPRRTEHLALFFGVADASFRNFIVRQFIEAAILGTVGTIVLLVLGFPYALGVGALMAMAALVPIVGYPVGLLAGAFMVAINNVWFALIYIVIVAVAQMLEATFVLPHIGDPRTVLPPVWITVAVTIGGGVAGFLGMLVAIPTASTVHQLIRIDLKRRQRLVDMNE